MIPSPWIGVVLALATFRLVRFIGWDDLPWLVRARAKLTGENERNMGENLYGDRKSYTRPVLTKFIHCPWCVGFWVGILVYVAWLEQPKWTLYVLAVFALNAAVGLVAKNLDP